jgi:hypothetical protein
MWRRLAKALSAKVRVILEPEGTELGTRLAESHIPYRTKRSLAKQPRRRRSNSHYGKQCGADLLVCRSQGPLAPRGVGDSINRQVGDLPHASP